MTEQSIGLVVPVWTVPDRLRKAREHAGLDQTALAREIGISRASVSAYERGASAPKRPVLLSWALRTRVPFEWLRDGTEPQDGPDPDGNPGSGDTGRYPATAHGECAQVTHLFERGIKAA